LINLHTGKLRIEMSAIVTRYLYVGMVSINE